MRRTAAPALHRPDDTVVVATTPCWFDHFQECCIPRHLTTSSLRLRHAGYVADSVADFVVDLVVQKIITPFSA